MGCRVKHFWKDVPRISLPVRGPGHVSRQHGSGLAGWPLWSPPELGHGGGGRVGRVGRVEQGMPEEDVGLNRGMVFGGGTQSSESPDPSGCCGWEPACGLPGVMLWARLSGEPRVQVGQPSASRGGNQAVAPLPCWHRAWPFPGRSTS